MNSNIIRVSVRRKNLFYKWLEFLRPLNNLTNKELRVLSLFLEQRFYLKKYFPDDKELNKVLMSEETKKIIMEKSNMNNSYFQVIMGKLRNKKAIINNDINPFFIPDIEPSSEGHKLILFFDINDNI